MNTKVRFFLISALLVLTNPTTHAECLQAGRWWVDGSWAELVFSGTVDKIVRTAPFGFRASVTVDRVWKGSVEQSIDLFVWELGGERPPISRFQRYVFALRRMRPTDDQRERDGAGVPDDAVAFTPILCGAEPYDDAERSGMLRDLGQGYAPK